MACSGTGVGSASAKSKGNADWPGRPPIELLDEAPLDSSGGKVLDEADEHGVERVVSPRLEFV